MSETPALRFLRKELTEMSDPAFLVEREIHINAGCTDFASSIHHAGGDWALYPSFYLRKSRTALSDLWSAEFGLRLEPDHMLLTKGSSEGIDLGLRASLRPGIDSVAYATPTFPMYRYWARISGISHLEFPLLGEDLSQLPGDSLLTSGAKALIVCQPNSPTGTPFPVKSILDLARRFQGLVMVDEAYVDFNPAYSLLPHIADAPNLVVLRSFSKAWSLAGLRLGAMIAHPSIVSALRVLQGPFGTSSIADQVLQGLLRAGAPGKAYVSTIGQERIRVTGELRKLKKIVRVFPSETNFVLFQHQRTDIHQALVAHQLFLNSCSNTLPGALRFSLRSPEENDRVLNCLRLLESS